MQTHIEKYRGINLMRLTAYHRERVGVLAKRPNRIQMLFIKGHSIMNSSLISLKTNRQERVNLELKKIPWLEIVLFHIPTVLNVENTKKVRLFILWKVSK